MTGLAPEDGVRRTEDGNAPNDLELLRRYVATRAEDAFAELVRRHLDGVYSAALRRVGGDRHLAEDVAQRVFVALARKAESLSHHPVLTSWLYVTARHESANVVRSERRRKARELEAHTMQEIFSEQEPSADWSRVAPVLDAVVDELPDADRTAILLRFVDRRPFADIGVTLRVSEDAARMRVDRALEKLRGLLARRGVTSTAAVLGTVLAGHAVAAAPAGLAATVTGAALAAPVAAGTLAAAVHFMITSKTVAGVAGIVVLAAVGTAVHEGQARHAAAETLAAATGEAARADERLSEVRQRAAKAEKAPEDARANLAAAAAPAATPAPAPAATPDPFAAGKAFLASHPEARALWEEGDRATIRARLGPVFQAMNLTAEERERIETIFVNSGTGVTTVAIPGGSIALRRESTLTPVEAEGQLVALLGAERTRRFAEMSRLAPTFDLTVKLASALYRTEPLTPEQAGRMMQVFAQASPVARGGPPGRPAGIDWAAIAAEAGGVLSPAQLEGLTAVRRNFEYQQAVSKLTKPAMDAMLTPGNGMPPTR